MTTSILESILDQSIADFERGKNSQIAEHKIVWTIVQYYDQRLIHFIQTSRNGVHSMLNENIKNRLNRHFITPKMTKFIRQHFESCQAAFLKKLEQKEIVPEKLQGGMVPYFQKNWDIRLLQLIQSKQTIEKEYAINYYFEYCQSLENVQKKQTKLKFDFPNLSSDTYTIPIQEAFTYFIKNIAEEGFVFQDNADAFFQGIYNYKLIDFKRKEIKKKEKIDPAAPTNIDLTNPSEADYLKVEAKIPPYKPAYLPYFPGALKLMGDKCRKVLKLYFFEKQTIQEMAEDEGIKKQSMHERLHKCSKQFGELLEKLKQQNG